MNLPPDKVRLLRSYDNEKKWELICDQVGALQKVSNVCTFLATTAAISKCFHKTENEEEADSVNLINVTNLHQISLFCLVSARSFGEPQVKLKSPLSYLLLP